MKILHFITSLRTGGAERLVVDLVRELREAGHEAEILLMDGTSTPLSQKALSFGIPVHSLSEGWKSMRDPRLLKSLVKFLEQGSYDIVHTHNTSCQLLAALASGRLQLNLFTTEHNTFNRRRRWRWYKGVDRWMYGRYTGIVCVSEDTKEELAKYLGRPRIEERMSVIQNGIFLGDFKNAEPSADMSSCPGYKVLMVSAFRPQKDHPTLIRALQHLPEDFVLFFAGGSETDEDKKYLAGCRRLTDELGLGERIHFLGVRSDVPGLLSAADAVVLSTHYEGGSVALTEAMASGKPVVASDTPGVHPVVHGAGLLFPEGDSEALASRLGALAADDALSARIGEQCRQRASSYDIAQTARSYCSFYYDKATGIDI